MSSTQFMHTAARTALLRSYVVAAPSRALTRSITLSAATRPAAACPSRPLARNNVAWSLTSSRRLHQSSEQQNAVSRSEGPSAPNVHTPKHFHDNRGKLKDGTIVSGQGADALSAGTASSSAVTVNTPRPAEVTTMQTGDWVMFHPVYTPKELTEIKVVERAATRLSERIATFMVFAARRGFDLVTGYKHVSPEAAEEWAKKHGRAITVEEMRQKGWIMDEKQWLNRFLFLESVAGVPGMVGGVLRHLRSLRLMKRDGGYIHTLLEEAENERMHLMTFMKIAKPSMLLRLMCLFAQGVSFNLFFLAYMLSPRAAHFFVGKLEEEAVKTYTGAIEEIEKGRLPAWKDMPAPQIAIDYWRLPSDAKVLDVIYAVRADEATHRFVNHSLASLEQDDMNPFALAEPDGLVKGSKAGFDRKEATEWADRVQRELQEKAKEAKNELAKQQ